MSQATRILNYLQNEGPLTPLDALDKFDCFRLGARIHDLRLAGHVIDTRDYVLPNGKHVAEYRYIRPKEQMEMDLEDRWDAIERSYARSDKDYRRITSFRSQKGISDITTPSWNESP
jgi:hypothetical protein